MKNNGFLPLRLVALILALAALVGILGGCSFPSDADQRTQAGIAYLEQLEKKDPSYVVAARKAIYDAKLAAQRDALIQQLTSGAMDPFSLFQNYVLMGDSRAVGYWYWDSLEKSRVLADGGHTIRNLKAQLDTLESMNPSQLFLCYGLNDISIGYWKTADEYVAEYIEILKEIRTRLPDTTIVVSSILPARDPAFQKSSKWRNIPQWSAALEKACKENGFLFANCDQLAKDYPNLWDPDGIHFRADFYSYWASCLVAAILMEGVE